MVRYISENDEDAPTLHEPAPNAHLVLLVESRVSQSFPLRGEISLGRDKSNSVVISDQKVSRYHADLSPIGDAFIITDRGSANGTYLNGLLLSQPTRLKDRDRIRIGDTHFLFTTIEPGPTDMEQLPVSAAQNVFPPAPLPNASVTVSPYDGRSIWILVGCLALIIVGLLIVVAALLGLFLGRIQDVGTVVSLVFLAEPLWPGP